MHWRGIEVGPRLSLHAAGEVFLGFRPETGQPVALRLFRATCAAATPLPEGAANPAFQAPVGPGEPAPNLARTLRIHATAGGSVVESELALGPTLGALIEGGAQPPGVAAGLALQALTGLEALHRTGRAHGRIHPENLVLDVDAGCLRLVDLDASLFEGVPRGSEACRIYASPLEAIPSFRGDVYAVGRVAEALLRGEPPLGGWRPLEPQNDDPGGRFRRFGDWVERCQSLDPARSFDDATSALAALRGLGLAGEGSVAHVRSGSWVFSRRRALRTLSRWRRGRARVSAIGPAEFSEVVASARAATLWRWLGFTALGLLLASAALIAGPRATLATDHFTDSGCAAAARPVALAREAAPGKGSGVVVLAAPGGALAAIDGCPVEFSRDPARFGVVAGQHDLRVKLGGGKVIVQGFAVRAGGAPLALAAPSAARGGGAAEGLSLVRALRAIAESTPERREAGPDPFELGLLEPSTLATLAIARSADVPARAALPDALGLDLDGLRAAERRLAALAAPCRVELQTRAAAALSVRQPMAPPSLHAVVAALAAARLSASAVPADPQAPMGRDSLSIERAILDGSGVPESRMLDGAVDEVAADEALRGCVAGLSPTAAALEGLAERVLAEAGVAESTGASEGSVR